MSAIQEQFLFDIIASSEELTFSIYDRAKDYGSTIFKLRIILIINKNVIFET